MNAKITVTIDDEIIEKAKKYAESKGTNLSELVEEHLKSLIQSSSNQSSTEI